MIFSSFVLGLWFIHLQQLLISMNKVCSFRQLELTTDIKTFYYCSMFAEPAIINRLFFVILVCVRRSKSQIPLLLLHRLFVFGLSLHSEIYYSVAAFLHETLAVFIYSMQAQMGACLTLDDEDRKARVRSEHLDKYLEQCRKEDQNVVKILLLGKLMPFYLLNVSELN